MIKPRLDIQTGPTIIECITVSNKPSPVVHRECAANAGVKPRVSFHVFLHTRRLNAKLCMKYHSCFTSYDFNSLSRAVLKYFSMFMYTFVL